MELKIEVVLVPVSDVEAAKAFYVDRLGLHCDMDRTTPDAEVRFVQVTPSGSACSFAFGRGITDMAPGSQQGIMAVVADADAALAHLQAVGVDAKGVDELRWGRFVSFADPDGNTWTLQQPVVQG